MKITKKICRNRKGDIRKDNNMIITIIMTGKEKMNYYHLDVSHRLTVIIDKRIKILEDIIHGIRKSSTILLVDSLETDIVIIIR